MQFAQLTKQAVHCPKLYVWESLIPKVYLRCDYRGQWSRITSRKTKPETTDKGVLFRELNTKLLDKLSTSFCCSIPASRILLVLKAVTTVTFQFFVSKLKVFF